MRRILRPHRPFLLDLLKQAGERIVQQVPRPWFMAEVGVWDGATSAYLLSQLPQLRIYMIDPWEALSDWQESLCKPTPEEKRAGKISKTVAEWMQRDFDKLYEFVVKSTDFANDRRTILRCKSLDIAHTIADNSLHMAFIDGDHRKQAVLDDTLAYWSKVLPGGVMVWCVVDPSGAFDAVREWGDRTKQSVEYMGQRVNVAWVKKAS